MDCYLLDTSMVVRYVHRGSPAHSLAIAATVKLVTDGNALVLTPQVLVEFWCVATRPPEVNGLGWEPEAVRSEVEDLLDKFRLLEDTPAVFANWLRVVASRRTRGRRTHDARLVAVMHTHGVTHLLTFNVDDFTGHPGIAVISPADVVLP